ncbi:hypothetical protein ANCDUO_03490 [Ancylostoma duodenale]|uniref:Major facilitator superfamily (MFS) profile domain-containing protein n=1 Tax=Ancylostoma duodenale TaxID=51022 RepID=A0A0C2H3P5_9BILA|nr:hypothetical protein ANCDUO_03490 [Ancylostoma duodenale]
MGVRTWLHRIRQVFIFSLLAFASNFEYGFSTTYLNTPVEQFKVFLNESFEKMDKTMTETTYSMLWNLILNIWFVGFFIGIWFSPLLNDRFGRKVGFLIGCGMALIGAVLRLFAVIFYRPELLIAGRFLTSMCEAVTYQSCILYLQECSPTEKRGMMTFLSEITYSSMCLFGMMLGTRQLLGDDLVALMTFAVPFCTFSPPERQCAFWERAVDADQRSKIISSIQNTVALWSMLLSSTYFLEQIQLDQSVASWSSTAMTLGYVLGTIAGSTWIERFVSENYRVKRGVMRCKLRP